MFKNALISVSNKDSLASFISPLAKSGMRVVSTGGTAKYLQDAGVGVSSVSEQTGFPEVMDGRVKTLHPHVHMCLLARGNVQADLDLLEEKGLAPFDLVVCNLYAFEDALKKGLSDSEQAEFIDIGGPSMLRAAAKNYDRITVLCDPSDYAWVAEKKELTLDDRKYLAAKVFAHVSAYDAMIAKNLSGESGRYGPDHSTGGQFVQELRYGENPAQKGHWYRRKAAANGLHNSQFIQGKPLSYNNILDLDAAVKTLREFQGPACISVKHNNPCGVAAGDNFTEAVKASIQADPVSVFGGIIAVNQTVTEAEAKLFTELFLECVVAPRYDKNAVAELSKKKNLRVLEWPDIMQGSFEEQIRTVDGGYLIQSQDQVPVEWSDEWEVHGDSPTEELKQSLVTAWKVCAHLKSNAIAIVSENRSVGLGMGQVNRVDAVEQAIERMSKHHGGCKLPVLASDAFFPFADSIERIAQAGIKWVIQPGGSIRDEEVIAKAKELGVNLVLTGQRHFLH